MAGMKKRMTTQNRQKSNAKKKIQKKSQSVITLALFSNTMYPMRIKRILTLLAILQLGKTLTGALFEYESVPESVCL